MEERRSHLYIPGFAVDFSDHSHLRRAETTLETTPVTISACHMNNFIEEHKDN